MPEAAYTVYNTPRRHSRNDVASGASQFRVKWTEMFWSARSKAKKKQKKTFLGCSSFTFTYERSYNSQ